MVRCRRKLETKGRLFPVHVSSRTSCNRGHTVGRELCSKESYQCFSSSVHSSCLEITEGQTGAVLEIYWYMLGAYASHRAGKKQCSRSLAEFFPCSSRSVRRSCAVITEGENLSYTVNLLRAGTYLAPICMQWATQRTKNSAQ